MANEKAMDEARIRQLREETLRALGQADEAGDSTGPARLAARLTQIEVRLARLEGAGPALPAAAEPPECGPSGAAAALASGVAQALASHPALQLLPLRGSDDGRCVMEPAKPCIGSGACRTFGH